MQDKKKRTILSSLFFKNSQKLNFLNDRSPKSFYAKEEFSYYLTLGIPISQNN